MGKINVALNRDSPRWPLERDRPRPLEVIILGSCPCKDVLGSMNGSPGDGKDRRLAQSDAAAGVCNGDGQTGGALPLVRP